MSEVSLVANYPGAFRSKTGESIQKCWLAEIGLTVAFETPTRGRSKVVTGTAFVNPDDIGFRVFVEHEQGGIAVGYSRYDRSVHGRDSN
jgi:hypothetical protein